MAGAGRDGVKMMATALEILRARQEGRHKRIYSRASTSMAYLNDRQRFPSAEDGSSFMAHLQCVGQRIAFALSIRFGYFELCCDRQYDFVLHIIMRLLDTFDDLFGTPSILASSFIRSNFSWS